MSRQRANLELFLGDSHDEIASLEAEILTQFQQTNTAWYNIAEIIGRATDKFSLSSKPMKTLLERVKITTSTASKLNTIAKSERLKTHKPRLASVHAWTVLYEITQLKDDAFEKLLSDTPEGEPITVALVNKARGKTVRSKSEKIIFEISIQKEAVLSDKFGEYEYGLLLEKLNEIINDHPEISIKGVSFFAKLEDNTYKTRKSGIRTKSDLTLIEIKKAIKNYKRTNSHWIHYRKFRNKYQTKKPEILGCSDEQEVIDNAMINPSDFFDEMGYDPNFYNEIGGDEYDDCLSERERLLKASFSR